MTTDTRTDTFSICLTVLESLCYENEWPSEEEYKEKLLELYPLIDSEMYSFEDLLSSYICGKGYF